MTHRKHVDHRTTKMFERREDLARLARALHVTPSVLDVADVPAGATATEAKARIVAAVGATVWRASLGIGNELARSTMLIKAIRAADERRGRRAEDPPTKKDPDKKPDEEAADDGEPCGTCRHRRDVHDEHACNVDGCECDGFAEQEEPADDQEPADGDEDARAAARQGISVGAYRRSARQLFGGGAAPKAQKRPAGVTAEDEAIALRQGSDPVAVARSRRALFGGCT